MKKVLMLSLAILMVASYAMADDIGVFTTTAGDVCELTPAGIAPLQVFVVHKLPVGHSAAGSQFKVNNLSNGWITSAAVQGGFLAIGDAFTNLTLAYQGCITPASGMITLLALNGFAFPFPGTPCSTVEVIPAPGFPAIISVDCNFVENPANGGKLVFNATTECPCVEPNATEQSSWGKVKALYR